MAYLEEATNLLIKEQNMSFSSESEFSDWYDCNLPAIVANAKELQFNCWIKFIELAQQTIAVPGIYNTPVYLNAQKYFLEILTERIYNYFNQ